MADNSNVGKYKSGFGNVKKTYIKQSNFKIVNGYTAEELARMGTQQNTYKTPRKA